MELLWILLALLEAKDLLWSMGQSFIGIKGEMDGNVPANGEKGLSGCCRTATDCDLADRW